MLPRKSLVPLRKEFSRIRKEGKTYDSPSFRLLVAFGQGPKAAFIVSKKVDRRSVVRHEIKRKLADTVDPLLTHLPKNVELVFLAKPKAVQSSRDELKIEIRNALGRARLVVATQL